VKAHRILPETVIVNAKPQLDKLGMPITGIVQPLKTAAGKFVGEKPLLARPLFDMPPPLGTVSHWINAAAKLRCGGDMSKAKPSELVQVPVYRGTSARFMNEIRADHRRKQKLSLMQRIRAEIASRFANKEAVAV
jgi:hypothetical protein